MADVEHATDPTSSSASTFTAALMRWSGAGGWVFAPVPDAHAPDAAGAFGRVPVVATVDGRTWATSVWRDTTSGWLLPVPARIRAAKDHGDLVTVAISVDPTRIQETGAPPSSRQTGIDAWAAGAAADGGRRVRHRRRRAIPCPGQEEQQGAGP